ncbi:MAG: HD domain-containing protein [Proteobacteria bacterium]|nr:MAG: HD domain-containing protein [Pseudomonadota bacterium]
MLRTSHIGQELGTFREQLHETFSAGESGIMARAKDLEQNLAEIINRAERYTNQLELLMEFSSILNSTLDSTQVRELAMKATCRLLGCEGATLYLIDEEKNELYFETIVGAVNAQQLKEIRLKIDENSIAGSVALKRSPLLVNNMESEARHDKRADKKNSFRTRTMVCVPVEARGRLLGVLQAINREEGLFTDADQRLLSTLGNQVAIAVENAQLYENVKTQFHETVFAMATAIEAKDRYTGGHTKRVALFSELIAKHMGLTKDQVHEVRISAVLHDIGKIGIDDKVLKKQAPLDKEEWEHMKQHPEMGYKILAHVKSMRAVTDGMRFHHERPDGLGYPLGLKGEEIPLIARIISVADTFDAMTSTRPYRKGMEYDVAYDEIVKFRGTQFDDKVVDAFIQAFKLERMGKKRIKEGT